MRHFLIACLVAPTLLFSQSLRELIEFATANNNIVASKLLTQGSKQKDIESSQSAYYPTIDLGASYRTLNERTPRVPGDIYSGYAKVGVDLYDGGNKSNTIKQNQAELSSSQYDTSSYKKGLQLSITEDFFNIKSVESTLKAMGEKSAQLEAELNRIQRFYEVGSATKDEVDRLQAALANNSYRIESVKFKILSLKRLLSIKIGKRVLSLDDSTLHTPKDIKKDLSDEIKSLQENSSSLSFVAKQIDSAYMPQVRLEDTYNFYDYDRSDAAHPESLDDQNKLMLSFNIRLFDNGRIKKKRESILIQKKALDAQIKEIMDIQAINVELALMKIETTKSQIQSSKTSLNSATSAFDMISQKYQAGSVNNITYLDSLSVKTNAQARYEQAINNLQIAYAKYYFYTNKTIKEFIK